jgi:hypothetical protein
MGVIREYCHVKKSGPLEPEDMRTPAEQLPLAGFVSPASKHLAKESLCGNGIGLADLLRSRGVAPQEGLP